MAIKTADELLTFSSMNQRPAKYSSSLFLQYNPPQQYEASAVYNTTDKKGNRIVYMAYPSLL